jgi:predicted ester cyclase
MQTNEASLHANKEVVVRFNREAIEGGSEAAIRALVDPEFINRAAAPGTPSAVDGLVHMIVNVLHAGLSDVKVEIHDMLAEGDRVVTRKTIRATHSGPFFGVAATNKRIAIEVIDIVRVRGGRYVEHWASNNLMAIVADLRASAPR